jgi:hypothetical protein
LAVAKCPNGQAPLDATQPYWQQLVRHLVLYRHADLDVIIAEAGIQAGVLTSLE